MRYVAVIHPYLFARLEFYIPILKYDIYIVCLFPQGRCEIAAAINKAVSDKRLRGPVMLSRDHHDVSGTDSPFRETSNITDGSKFCADMAVHNAIGIILFFVN